MAESDIVTGSRCDLTVDRSRCLRMRFSENRCNRCVEVCPHGAVTVDGDLAVDPQRCRGCLLCTAVCPPGAIEPDLTYKTIHDALCRPLPIIISCHNVPEQSHLNTPCFGFLSPEYLVALHASPTPGISLNIIHCSKCPNHQAITWLREQIHSVEVKTGLPISSKIKLIERPSDLHFQHETIGRRGFFTSLTRSLIREAASVLSPSPVENDTKASYAQKHVPLRRRLLNQGLERLSDSEQQQAAASVCWEIRRSDSCDGCRACTKICPTGALIENGPDDAAPYQFNESICIGCGLCIEFCLNEALSIHKKTLSTISSVPTFG